MKRYFKFTIVLVVILSFMNITGNAVIERTNNKIIIEKEDRLQNIKEKGVLTVVSTNREPFSYKDSNTGQFSGSDSEIIQEVANRLGIKKINVKYLPFATMMEEFTREPEYDVVVDGVHITDERKQIVDFTNPIYNVGEVLVYRKDSGVNSKEDIKKFTIGILGGSVFIPIAEEWKNEGVIKDYILFYNSNDLQKALENRAIDAILTNSISGKNIVLKNPKSNFKLLVLEKDKYKAGYVLKKGDTTLLSAINEKLQEMRNDGTLYEIMARHGLTEDYVK